MEGNPILAAATILDRQFKNFAFADQGEKQREAWELGAGPNLR